MKGNVTLFLHLHTPDSMIDNPEYIFNTISLNLSYDAAFGSEIMPCIKIAKPLVVFRFWYHYEMTSITMLRT